MPVSLPILPSYKNLPTLFEKIATAKVPDTFSQTFMAQTLGLKASTDRPLIPYLRTLGILDPSNKPTHRYHLLRNKSKAKQALATAIREAYEPLFSADERANEKSSEELRGLISQVAGTDEDTTKKIAYTFNAIVRLADFSATALEEGDDRREDGPSPSPSAEIALPVKLRSEFHYNIQVHLPSNGTEDTYLNIFNALRQVFQ